jgi:hypothetical protein
MVDVHLITSLDELILQISGDAECCVPPDITVYLSAEDIPEDLGIDLLRIIHAYSMNRLSETEASAGELTLQSFAKIVSAIVSYRNAPWEQPHRLSYWLKRLRDARAEDKAAILDQVLADPDREKRLLSALLSAGRAVGVLDDTKHASSWSVTIIGDDGGRHDADQHAQAWSNLLLVHPAGLERVLDAALASEKEPSANWNAKLRRRLKAMIKSPSLRRLRNLIGDAEKEGELARETLKSLLDLSVRRGGVLEEDGAADRIDQLASLSAGQQEQAIANIAAEAVRVLDRSPKPVGGHITYARTLADVYRELTGTYPKYSSAVESSRSHEPGEKYGPGLEFMMLGLQLMDRSADASTARYLIDELRPAGS